MDFIVPALVILFFVIVSVPIANRFRLPLEVFLVIGSCLISFIPGLPLIRMDPKLVFNLFLPLILFYAAYFTSIQNLKTEIRSISLLSVGLVIFTMLVTALVTRWLFPSFTWAEGFLLGAIVSPTDATSATAIIRQLNAPQRLLNILEGESLVNDATALVLFRFALAAVLGQVFTIPEAILEFAIVTAGGIAIGLVTARISVFILEKVNFTAAAISLSFITALSVYILAEELHCSGVMATVVCGIYFGMYFPAAVSSRNRVFAKASWDTAIFIINGFVFTLIGLNLPSILQSLAPRPLGALFIAGLILSVAIMVTRMLWVFTAASISRWIKPSIRLSDPQPLWRFLFIMGWCGMRGIVSLAAALSLPYLLAPPIYFPHRDLILFLTFCVIVVTLLTPTFTLPWLLKWLGLQDTDSRTKQESMARLRTLQGICADLQIKLKNENIPAPLFKSFSEQIQRRIRVVQTQQADIPYSTLDLEYQASKRLLLASIESERTTLIGMRNAGEVSEEIFHMLLEELDLEEMRAKTLRV